MKTNLITALVVVALCSGVPLWQRGHLKDLREEIEETRTSLATSPRTSNQPDRPPMESPVTGIVSDEDAEAKTTATVARLLEIFANKEENSAAGFFLAISRMLEFLHDYSTDELYLIMQKLNGLAADNEDADDILPLLLMVLANWHERDPDAALAWVGKQGWDAEEWLPK